MDKKVTGILSYIGILWLVAYFAGDKEGAKLHLNQGLILLIGEVCIGFISGFSLFLPAIVSLLLSLITGILGIAIFVFAIMGIISALNDNNKELPIIGQIKLLK